MDFSIGSCLHCFSFLYEKCTFLQVLLYFSKVYFKDCLFYNSCSIFRYMRLTDHVMGETTHISGSHSWSSLSPSTATGFALLWDAESHRMTERLRSKENTRSSCPTPQLKQCCLNQAVLDHVQNAFEYLQH